MKKFVGLVTGALLASTSLTSAQVFPSSGLLITQGGLAPASSPRFTGTVTFPDGATWASTGLADAASYSTTSTPFLSLTPTWTFSSTANNVHAIAISPTLIAGGASAGNDGAITIVPSLGTSAANFGQFRGINLQLSTAAGYSGTAALGVAIYFRAPSVGGTNPFTNYQHVLADGIANGNGITSGTVTNYHLNLSAHTAAAGAGGTVANTGILVTVPSSSSAGNTDKALAITGNGGALSTKYAIYSDSTAPSAFGGPLITSGTIPTIAGGACGAAANGAVTAGSRTNAGNITIGAGATTVCTVVFAVALPTAPVCVITASNAAAIGALTLAYVSANTTAGFVITGSVLASTNWNYICL